MKTNEPIDNPITLLEIKQVPIETSISIAGLQVCYNCESNSISPYETGLCDFCADEIRFSIKIF